MKAVLALALGSALLVANSVVHAEVTKPFPGVTLVKRPGSALVIADLCAPGVAVRATKYDERKRTPESWGNLVGAEVAINADFFDFPAATLADGRARGAGEDWPAAQQLVGLRTRGEDRHYWQFGKLLGADPIEPMSVAPAPATHASEIVGGHNVLIRNGKSLAPGFDGDGVLNGAYRRTAIGTNKERSLLYLFTTANLSTGAQLVSALLAHAQEGGAPDIDFASNLDGGGSTQMFVKGQGQIVTSGRLVVNHVGVMAKGSGAAPMCPGKRPIGYVDAANCSQVAGWALDPDEPQKQLDVLLSYEGLFPDPKTRITETRADLERPDLLKPFGTTKHGWSAPPPLSLFDGKPHPIWGYAKDSAGGRGTILANSPKTFTCAPPVLSGVKRHIVNPTVLAAWKLDTFVDLAMVDDATLAALPESTKIDAAPVLARADGADGLYVIDGSKRRRIVDDASRRAWRFDPSAAISKTTAEMLALESGAPLGARPILARASGPEVYWIDAPPSEADPIDPLVAGGSAGRPQPGKGAPGAAAAGAGGTDEAADGCAVRPRATPFGAVWSLTALALYLLRFYKRTRRFR